MTKKLNPLFVEEKLKSKKITIFTPNVFFNLFDVLESTGRSFLNYYVKKGFFIKLKNGFYILKSTDQGDYEIANKIYKPSYISFETALSRHNIMPEIVYAITSATTKASRKYTILNKSFIYHKIKKELFFGYDTVKINNQTVLIANKEKALLDYLYFVSLKKKPENDRLELREISINKIKKYLKFYNSPLLEKQVKQLLKFS